MDLLTGLVALSPDGRASENALMRTVCARAVGLEPLPFEPAPSDADPVLAEVAEQFSVDVAGVTAEQRAALVSAYGAEVLGVVALMYIADFVPRVRAGLAALGMTFPDPVGWDHTMHPADALLNRFTSAVGAMRGLDPLTTRSSGCAGPPSTTADCAHRCGRVPRCRPAVPRRSTTRSAPTRNPID
jgi:hypothetical protein